MTLTFGIRSLRIHRSRRLIPILTVAVALRLAAALAMGDAVEPLPGAHDQVSYDALAARVVSGHGFTFGRDWWPATRAGEPTAHWSFLYTGALAALYAVAGPHPLAARLLQAVLLGLLLPWGMHRLTGPLFGERAALLAAAVAALYAYFVYYSATLMTEMPTIVAVVWFLAVAMRADARSGWRTWLALGALLGTIALLRQVAALPAGLVLAGVVAPRRDRRAVRGALLAGLVAGLMIAPVTWRNFRTFGRLVPLNTNAGFAFFWANHPIHGTDFHSILPDDGPGYYDLIPAELRPLDEAALDAALLRRGLRFAAERPGRYLLLSLSRIDDYFQFWPSRASSAASNLARTLSFGLALPLLAAGLWIARERWRETWPLWSFAAAYTVIHLASWALIRYRLPVDAALLPFAGLALDRAWQRWLPERRSSQTS